MAPNIRNQDGKKHSGSNGADSNHAQSCKNPLHGPSCLDSSRLTTDLSRRPDRTRTAALTTGASCPRDSAPPFGSGATRRVCAYKMPKRNTVPAGRLQRLVRRAAEARNFLPGSSGVLGGERSDCGLRRTKPRLPPRYLHSAAATDRERRPTPKVLGPRTDEVAGSLHDTGGKGIRPQMPKHQLGTCSRRNGSRSRSRDVRAAAREAIAAGQSAARPKSKNSA